MERTARIDYLRVSVTDRCNLRCSYCVPKEGLRHLSQKELLRLEEIYRLVRIFISLGVRKVRLTGGEPLVRKGIVKLIDYLSQIKGIDGPYITTNGILLSGYAKMLRTAGLKGINLSLDTLKEDRFRSITDGGSLSRVRKGISEAKKAGFSLLKVNSVIIRGVNDDEVFDFVNFASQEKIILRFIEFMPTTPLWREERFISQEEIKDILRSRFSLRKIESISSGPAEYYEIPNKAVLGFIATRINNCVFCNRLRLTSVGRLKLCLYGEEGLDLRKLLRQGYSDDAIREIIAKSISGKRRVNFTKYKSKDFYMCSIGG